MVFAEFLQTAMTLYVSDRSRAHGRQKGRRLVAHWRIFSKEKAAGDRIELVATIQE